jgi:hypothetical protein
LRFFLWRYERESVVDEGGRGRGQKLRQRDEKRVSHRPAGFRRGHRCVGVATTDPSATRFQRVASHEREHQPLRCTPLGDKLCCNTFQDGTGRAPGIFFVRRRRPDSMLAPVFPCTHVSTPNLEECAWGDAQAPNEHRRSADGGINRDAPSLKLEPTRGRVRKHDARSCCKGRQPPRGPGAYVSGILSLIVDAVHVR